MNKFECESEYDSWFNKIFSKMTRGIEEHQFKHYNRSMGCHIHNKDHYKSEMKKRRMIPYDIMEEFAEEWDTAHPEGKYDTISTKAMDVIRSLKMSSDKNGNLRLGDRAVTALQEVGAIPSSNRIPKNTPLEGGFNV